MESAEEVGTAQRWRRRARVLFLLCVGGVVAVVLVILSAPLWSYGELASHFRWHVGIGGALFGLVTLLARQWRPAVLLLAIGLWGVLPEGRLWLGSPETEAGNETIDVVCANVLRINDLFGPVITEIIARDPDVIGLLEISPEWRDEAVSQLEARYPYHAEGLDTRRWNQFTWGMLLFSKTPLSDAVAIPVLRENRRLRPILRAAVDLGGEPLTIDLVHAQRPGATWRLADRRKHFEALREPMEARHRLVLGDLNTTSTSPLFTDLCERLDVRDSRPGFGRQPTLKLGSTLPGPVPIPIPGPLRVSVAIDHALVSDGLAVLSRETFRIPGSDHRGIHVRLSVRNAGTARAK
ncbi:MAG: endonuclease/exonuclease/phosphatase family protein [Planctomycetota bacterium]